MSIYDPEIQIKFILKLTLPFTVPAARAAHDDDDHELPELSLAGDISLLVLTVILY